MAQTKEVKVKDLKAGDDLGGTMIIADPIRMDYCGSKDRALINVRYPSGKESVRIWGWFTTVKIKSTDK